MRQYTWTCCARNIHVGAVLVSIHVGVVLASIHVGVVLASIHVGVVLASIHGGVVLADLKCDMSCKVVPSSHLYNRSHR